VFWKNQRKVRKKTDGQNPNSVSVLKKETNQCVCLEKTKPGTNKFVPGQNDARVLFQASPEISL